MHMLIKLNFKFTSIVQSLDFLKIIEEISTVLKKNKELKQIIPITTAKVPIIKFEHRATQLEGDISLYNILVSLSVKK